MKLTTLFIALLISFEIASAQSSTGAASQNSPAKVPLNIENGKNVWMLTYFRQRYPTRIEIDAQGKTVEVPLPDPMLINKLHIALSSDGRHWTPLNDNKPVWEHHVRDPYVRRGPDGVWRILSTGGGRANDREKVGPSCLYITSKDLITWQVEGNLPLMKDVRSDSGTLARNIWAPEWFFDDRTNEYVLIWSSSFKDAGWKESRLWSCRTRDWKTFTPANVFFAPPYSVIDGTLLKEKGTYYLFHKEEEFGAKTGERRSIRLATSKNLEGPYSVVEGPLNKGQIVPVITEGPTAIKDPVKPGWLLLYDYCMTNRFGASYSPDLIHWTVEDDVNFPSEARHGCISMLTSDEAKALVRAYPDKP
ncbi:glycoside hydrolase family 43 protein [Spirosoma flavus]